MYPTSGYAALSASTPLSLFSFERRALRSKDVLIRILYCGVCHSDLHQVKDEWGRASYPLVPGHEIIGEVTEVGLEASRFSIGEKVGVGCYVDSCRSCSSCEKGLEQFCDGLVKTYNGVEKDKSRTFGGYSSQIVVDEDFVFKIPSEFRDSDLPRVAPLLCAGITTFSPLKHWGIQKGHKVGVLGLGGLGHMAVQYAAAFGAEVTVLSHSLSKKKDAERLGAHAFVVANDEELSKLHGYFDLLMDTVSAPHALEPYLKALTVDGVLVLLGLPEKFSSLDAHWLISKRRKLAGSLIGGVNETQAMLDYSAKHSILCDVEVVPLQRINEAFERMMKSDVRYRFVIDMQTLNS